MACWNPWSFEPPLRMPAMFLPIVTTLPFWHKSSTKWRYSAVNSVSINPVEVEMAAELLRASEAARRLGISTKELLRLIHERKIRFVMVKGIAHVPDDAIDEYRAKAS
jgi:excisionase family DNA binding protein